MKVGSYSHGSSANTLDETEWGDHAGDPRRETYGHHTCGDCEKHR